MYKYAVSFSSIILLYIMYYREIRKKEKIIVDSIYTGKNENFIHYIFYIFFILIILWTNYRLYSTP